MNYEKMEIGAIKIESLEKKFGLRFILIME